eukprot:gene3786-13854_t
MGSYAFNTLDANGRYWDRPCPDGATLHFGYIPGGSHANQTHSGIHLHHLDASTGDRPVPNGGSHPSTTLMPQLGTVLFPDGATLTSADVPGLIPGVGSYAFTTLMPQLGTVLFPDGATLTTADVPGLIQGASTGLGRGNAFLRHVERSRCLALIVDLSGGQPGALVGLSPAAQLQVLLEELATYSNMEMDARQSEGQAHPSLPGWHPLEGIRAPSGKNTGIKSDLKVPETRSDRRKKWKRDKRSHHRPRGEESQPALGGAPLFRGAEGVGGEGGGGGSPRPGGGGGATMVRGQRDGGGPMGSRGGGGEGPGSLGSGMSPLTKAQTTAPAPSLLSRPCLIIANKVDICTDPDAALAELKASTMLPIVVVSATLEAGLDRLKNSLRALSSAT